jgi:hypothetical protein
MSRGRLVEGRQVLVRYRLVGGVASVDQRLTVYADGLVGLDEHHRSRDSTHMRIPSTDLADIRAALEEIPEGRWSRGPTLALSRARVALRHLVTPWPEPDLGRSYFQLRQGRRTIAEEIGGESDAEAARVLLDNVRVNAVRLAESLKPTGA